MGKSSDIRFFYDALLEKARSDFYAPVKDASLNGQQEFLDHFKEQSNLTSPTKNSPHQFIGTAASPIKQLFKLEPHEHTNIIEILINRGGADRSTLNIDDTPSERCEKMLDHYSKKVVSVLNRVTQDNFGMPLDAVIKGFSELNESVIGSASRTNVKKTLMGIKNHLREEGFSNRFTAEKLENTVSNMFVELVNNLQKTTQKDLLEDKTFAAKLNILTQIKENQL